MGSTRWDHVFVMSEGSVGRLTVFRKMKDAWIKIHNRDSYDAKLKVRRWLEDVERIASSKTEGLRGKGGGTTQWNLTFGR